MDRFDDCQRLEIVAGRNPEKSITAHRCARQLAHAAHPAGDRGRA
jgi:hypothetical protein